MIELMMMNHHESAHGEQLNARMREAFDFEFTEWFQRNQWKPNYECYSIMDDGEMLSNVGVYKTPLLISGQRVMSLQIGGVATHKDQWGKGYSRRIMEHIQEKYPGVPQFLHANASVTRFYPRFGFRRVAESTPHVACTIDNHVQPIQLQLGDERLDAFIQDRAQYSRVLDCMDAQTVQVFNLLGWLGKSCYYLAELDVVVIAAQKGDVLTIVDAMAKAPVAFEALVKQLPFAGVRTVEFGFCPDWLGVAPDWTPITDDDNALFVLGDLSLPEHFKFPTTSMT